MLADLRTFVERETPSDHKPACDAFARFLAEHLRGIGNPSVEIVRRDDAGDHVVARWPGPANEPPILLVGHFDTVWPHGTIAQIPFSIVDGKARGPGVYDMKAGLVQGCWAIRALFAAGSQRRPMVMICNSDEELGSLSSRALIEDEARKAEAVLVLEPAKGGALKTARKSVGIFTIEVAGRASHAGSEPYAGVSAIEELARQTLALHAMNDKDRGISVNVGTFHGGTRRNVVAANAIAQVDTRTLTNSDADELAGRIGALQPQNTDARVIVTGGVNRPAMERTETIARLFERARELAAGELGMALDEISAGGGSDGSFCAALGIPVLDGLGAVGDGAHALGEHVIVSEMPLRAALVATLLAAPLDTPAARTAALRAG
ncbi:MAG TPA: hypothetical protein DCK99_11520 [Blastocatellia bacterium]|nr:hypothetical protein [Blastocatellia bacterium]